MTASSGPVEEQQEAVREEPPICCGEHMIRNGVVYECADAYFYLHDDGLLGDCGDLITWRRRLTAFDRERHEHWLASRVPASGDQP